MGGGWTRSFAALVDLLFARRRAVLVATAITAALLVVAATTIRIDGRLEILVPEGESAIAGHVRAFRRLGAAETIHVDVSGDDAAERLRVAADVAARMESSGAFVLVAGPATPEAMARTGAVFTESAPLLLRESDYVEIEARLRPDDLADRIEARAARLLEPGAEAFEAMFRRDPLDLGGLALRSSLSGGTGGVGGASAGVPLSADGRHVLVTAVTKAPMGDEEAGATIAALLDGCRERAPPGTRVDWLGGHRFYRSNAASLRRDVSLVSVLGLVLVVAVVLVSFRGLRSASLAGIAAVAACVCGAAAAALAFGAVSGIALAFGAALSGICVDYVLHLRATPERGETRDFAVRRSFAAIGPSVAVGGLTSAASFLVLLASPVEAHRQIGVAAAAAISGALVFALTAGPVIASGGSGAVSPGIRGPDRLVRISGAIWRTVMAWPRVALVVAALAVGVSALLLPSLRFERDLRRFEFKDEATLAAEREFEATWGGILSRRVLLVRGLFADHALRETEGVLRAAGPGAAAWTSVAGVLPSTAEQTARRARWDAFWTVERRARLVDDLAAAAAPLGLRAAAFDPFVASLTAQSPALDAGTWRQTLLHPLVDRLLVPLDDDDEFVSVIAVPRDAPELSDAAFRRHLDSAGVAVVGGGDLALAVADAARRELESLALPAVLAVAALLALYYRNVRHTALALLPLGGGLAVAGAGLVIAGEPLSLMNLPVIVPTLGFAVDYGIFTLDALDAAARDPGARDRLLAERGAGVLAAALTTAAGGAAMLVAAHPAVRTIGLVLVLSVTSCLAIAWLAIPGLHGLTAAVKPRGGVPPGDDPSCDRGPRS